VIFGCLDSIRLKLIVVPNTRLISNYSEWVAADDKILFNTKVDHRDTIPDRDSRTVNVSPSVNVRPRNGAKVQFDIPDRSNINVRPNSGTSVQSKVLGRSDVKPVLQYSSTVSGEYSDECLCSDVLNLDSADRGAECRQLRVDHVESVRGLKCKKSVMSEHSRRKFEFNINKFKVPIHGVNDLNELYPRCFKGIGNLPGEYHIELRAGAQSHIAAPRRYPVHLKAEICRKLSEMEDLGVIMKCDDASASDWVNQLAFSRKANGDLRICLDPRHLNKAIKRTHYRAMTLEEITHRLCGATVFSKLDAKHGFWAIKLDRESSEMCTFQSPAGKYRFVRLPFGLCVSQDIFQKHMDDILRRIDLGDDAGVIGIADDFVVYGKDRRSHDKAIHMLLQSAEHNGLVFRPEKCAIRQSEVNFFGLIWNETGVKPDPKKCDEIQNRPSPKNVTELQSFLGLVQYLSAFVCRLSDKARVLRSLTKKAVPFEWTAEHEACFRDLKAAIRSDLILRHFNPQAPTVLEVDASLTGLGCALLQNEMPVAFASKALTPTESRYANIERELLAVVFAVERFHTFIYGKHVTVYSDHKPLENINLKQLSDCPPRLQRMLLRLQQYDVTIIYKPGNKMIFADYLSRVCPTRGDEIVLEQTIHAVHAFPETVNKIRLATTQDTVLGPMAEMIMRGWPARPDQLPNCLKPYHSLKDTLVIEDGMVFSGERLVVPKVLQPEYLKKLHTTHQGITKTLLRAKQNLYWLGMDNEVKSMINSCQLCQRFQKSQPKEDLVEREMPGGVWDSLHSDVFEVEGVKYLLVIDEFSKFPFVRRLKTETSRELIDYLEELFGCYGKPTKFYSDNGGNYASQLFKDFMQEWEVKHITSSPRYPQSNGVAERTVGYIKPIMTKSCCGKECSMVIQDMVRTCRESENLHKLLLDLRTTPLGSGLPSPAELLYGRQIRNDFVIRDAMRPYNERVYSFQEGRRAATRRAHGESDSKYEELIPGQKVLFQQHVGSEWQPATVVAASEEPRSYVLRTSQDTVVRRNRRFIRDPPVSLDSDMKTVSEDDRIRNDARRCARLVEQYSDLRFIRPRITTHAEPATVQPSTTQSDDKVIATHSDNSQPVRRSTRTRTAPIRYGYN
jgi:transposase InsO family protein